MEVRQTPTSASYSFSSPGEGGRPSLNGGGGGGVLIDGQGPDAGGARAEGYGGGGDSYSGGAPGAVILDFAE